MVTTCKGKGAHGQFPCDDIYINSKSSTLLLMPMENKSNQESNLMDQGLVGVFFIEGLVRG